MRDRYWEWTFMKKTLLISLAICILLFGGCSGRSAERLYRRSVKDAANAEVSEVLPLVTLTPDSDTVTWNEDGARVLLLSWHRHPERYAAGESFECTYGVIWTFTDGEILAWYDENSEGVTDWPLRLKQLIGLPPSSEYTHFTAFWAELDELVRPAFQTDVTKQLTAEELKIPNLGEHGDWFIEYADSAYGKASPYPWTRLGYTYDWAGNGTEYGLTEFIILEGSTVEIEWTLSTEEFIEWMAAN